MGCFRAWFTISLHAKIWMSPRRRRRDATATPQPLLRCTFSLVPRQNIAVIKIFVALIYSDVAARLRCIGTETLWYSIQLSIVMKISIHTTYTQIDWGAVAVVFFTSERGWGGTLSRLSCYAGYANVFAPIPFSMAKPNLLYQTVGFFPLLYRTPAFRALILIQ